jgi:methionyl-tRNA formyltransferase
MSSNRIVYMATGDIAIPAFQALINESAYNTVALITQPDKPFGRKQVLTPPLIKTIAEGYSIPVLQPERVKNEQELQLLRDLGPDIIVVMAYGQILPKALLEIPKVAIINLHASLLPKHRGASCIQAAIDQGDEESGMTVMHVTEGLDEGDIILKKPFRLTPQITGGELHEILANDGPPALLEALGLLISGNAPRQPQDDTLSNYVPKLMRSNGEIDWGQPAEMIERRVRAYDPWPGTSTSFKDTKGRVKRLKVFPQSEVVPATGGEPGKVISLIDGLIVACGDGGLRITELQPDGKKRMLAQDFLKNGQIKIGDVLGSE